MVRFKARPRRAGRGGTHVSIPIWFDLKSLRLWIETLILSCFNSYMVRFKVYNFAIKSRQQLVSIPIWFDLKFEVLIVGYAFGNEFQFLYGSI